MRNSDELDSEGPDLDAIPLRNNVDLHLRRIRLGEPPRPQQAGGERRRVKRAAQPRPQRRNRADMIFVRMRDDEREEIGPNFLDKSNVGVDEIDARQIGPSESETAIDHDPFAPAGGAEAIERGVHADLTETAERDKDEFVQSVHRPQLSKLMRLLQPDV